MKTFKQFLEAVGDPLTSRNVIRLDQEAQRNLNKTIQGQMGPGSTPSPNRNFTLVPASAKPPVPTSSKIKPQTNPTRKPDYNSQGYRNWATTGLRSITPLGY